MATVVLLITKAIGLKFLKDNIIVPEQINGMTDWKLVNIVKANRTLNAFPQTAALTMLNETVIGADLGDTHDSEKIAYFGAPDYYCGKIFIYNTINVK